MNSRQIFKALALAFAVAAVGCTQRTIIEEPYSEDEGTSEPHLTAIATDEESGNELANQALYVRSGEVEPGEQQAGPQPEPWHQRLGPQPEPWHRDNDGQDDGKSPPPPSDPKPGDPNPKP